MKVRRKHEGGKNISIIAKSIKVGLLGWSIRERTPCFGAMTGRP
ncbi:uncharacterized protein G2W53_015991 [Senna tora]|uniref:Uncharacterized protein n=1 Tax=Senna tora TaxID=362788 RepID=A0A834WWL7_9FABA|nr:uncharacterized protein G2W53_015991 [Senna tora]